ncbi:hypothetical protein DdX_19837 [Ditylenchus destructor]|uniref:Uncharacterized protein n=1 Tax=Ditylenchus destructor TaxID=166010 RepID=A0AAD4MHQ4_9BILA|nr:hypothetical protein DdX_19837 [Ditylenchus destructor]
MQKSEDCLAVLSTIYIYCQLLPILRYLTIKMFMYVFVFALLINSAIAPGVSEYRKEGIDPISGMRWVSFAPYHIHYYDANLTLEQEIERLGQINPKPHNPTGKTKLR